MNYQVIARKYRPQTFSDLVGQEHITRTLSQSLDKQRLHHAYLFSGVRGTGKTTTARILAKGLNCRTGITSRPCLQCPACIEIAAGNSIDVLEIDAASNTGVDNVRDVIINNIAMAPARDRFKVFVIDEVHMLSSSAFNALLKTLEEPPPHVIFIMATTELHKVPDTILSRCQQFEFRQIPTEKIFQRLRQIADLEALKIADSALREIARAGAGSLRDAQSAFDQVIAFSGDEITEDDVGSALGLISVETLGGVTEALADQDTSKILALVDEISTRGYDLRNFTRELMAYLRHLLVVKSGITSGEMLGVTDVEIAHLKKLSSKFSEEDLVRCFHLLTETEKDIKDSPHPRFQLEIGLVKLSQANRLRTLDELISRLEDLETTFAGGGGSGFAPSPPGTINNTSDNKPDPAKSTSHKTSQPVQSSSREVITKPVNNRDTEPPDYIDFDISEPIDSDIEGTPNYSVKQGGTDDSRGEPGDGIAVILRELNKLNRNLVLTALEDAQNVNYHDGVLTATFGSEDIFAKRIRESGPLFRDIGDRLFGKPISIDIRITGQVEESIDEEELKRRQLFEQAKNNPAVKMILEKTRGEIVWVKQKEQ